MRGAVRGRRGWPGVAGDARGGAGRPLAGEAPPSLFGVLGCRRRRQGLGCRYPALSRCGSRYPPGSLGAPDPVSRGLLPPGPLPGSRVPQSGEPKGTPGTWSQPTGEHGETPGRSRGYPCRGRLDRWLSLRPLSLCPLPLLELMHRNSSHHQITTAFLRY